jgi:hypothetical protein
MDWKDILGTVLGSAGDILKNETPEEKAKREAEEKQSNNITFFFMVFGALLFLGLFIWLAVRKK